MRISDWSSDVCSSDLMNPVLLKPQADRTSQLVVHGQVRGKLGSGNFRSARGELLEAVLASYRRLQAQCDIVVVEGAGSPAEVNLRAGDIAHMGFARAAGVPGSVVGGIDRGRGRASGRERVGQEVEIVGG